MSNSPKAADIAYIRLRAPDLGKMRVFLENFGLTVEESVNAEGTATLYSHGTGGDPYQHIVEEGPEGFVGLGFNMESSNDLRQLSEMEGASGIEEITDAPRGGQRVRFTDPQGYEVDGIFGWKKRDTGQIIERPAINTGEMRIRLREPVRLEPRSSQVKRLGHCVLFVADFRDAEAWYKSRFGFVTSDEIYAGEEVNVIGAFMRCDRGDIPVDHHTLFLLQNPEQRGMQHAAFEVHDWDDLMLGHDHLEKGDYQHDWGIGKHILGSQVFDYWQDPYGNVHEHFTDGDLFDVHIPPAKNPVESLLATQWGPGR